MTAADVRAAAVEYVEAGLFLVPIAEGTKRPTNDKWNRRENCITTIEAARAHRGGIGLAHSFSGTCAFDIDDLAATRAHFAARDLNVDTWLESPYRVGIRSGRANRAKLLFRVPEPLESITVSDASGRTIFEFRCATREGLTHQDVLPPSIHPDGQPYAWDLEDLITSWSDIPPLPTELRAVWTSAGESRHASPGASPIESYKPPTGVSREAAADLLKVLDPRPYHEWLRVGMALHHEYGDEGLDLWDAWSSTADNYVGRGDLERRFEGFGRSGSTVTLRYVLKRAKELGATLPNSTPLIAIIGRVDFATLRNGAPPAREWVVRDWAPRGTLTLLAGAGGVGKSLAAQQLALACAAGTDWLGLQCTAGPVVGFFCEDDAEELLRRAFRICQAEGIRPAEVADQLHLDARAGRENTLVSFTADNQLNRTALLDALRAKCAEVRPVLVILDNAAQLFAGMENARAAVTAFCNALTGIAIESGAAVLLLAHPAKVAGSEFSGSTAWEAAVRARWFLERTESGALSLRQAKANYAELREIELEMHDGVLRRRTAADVAVGASNASHGLLEALTKYTGEQIQTSHTPTARNYLPKLAAADGYLDGITPKVARDALKRLIDIGRIRIGAELPWRQASRHKAYGLIEVAATDGDEEQL